MKTLLSGALIVAAWAGSCSAAPAARPAAPARQVEKLGRGVVAIVQPDGKRFLSWRLLPTDAPDVAFNIYRTESTFQTATRKLNAAPIMGATNFVDSSASAEAACKYLVQPVNMGATYRPVRVGASGSFSVPANAPARPYLSIPLKTPAGYAPNDASVGDLDGDGEYEIVLHQAGRGRATSSATRCPRATWASTGTATPRARS